MLKLTRSHFSAEVDLDHGGPLSAFNQANVLSIFTPPSPIVGAPPL